jgi:hypothetical protein
MAFESLNTIRVISSDNNVINIDNKKDTLTGGGMK